ncbi:hypothetical protein ABZ565_08025 [Streptomyces sp. NPDC016469]|uniref:hypothetical protein n=1 Tax=Streptomyces sp. NPDC016469 TaxID=3157191 RepID=UPI00340FAA54
MHRIFQEYPGMFSRVSEVPGHRRVGRSPPHHRPAPMADAHPQPPRRGARKDLALATLAAITHADNPDVGAILKTLSAALRDAPENITDPIVELTAQGLGNRPAAQQ